MFHQNWIVMAYMYSEIVFLIFSPEERSNTAHLFPSNKRFQISNKLTTEVLHSEYKQRIDNF